MLIHDGARPFVSKKIIDDVINSLEKSGAAVPGVPAVDTQKQVDENGKIVGEYYPTGNIPAFVERLRQKGDLKLDMSVFVPRV